MEAAASQLPNSLNNLLASSELQPSLDIDVGEFTSLLLSRMCVFNGEVRAETVLMLFDWDQPCNEETKAERSCKIQKNGLKTSLTLSGVSY